MGPVHIRDESNEWNLCGVAGGSISLKHFTEEPEQVAVLHMCEQCVALAQKQVTGTGDEPTHGR